MLSLKAKQFYTPFWKKPYIYSITVNSQNPAFLLENTLTVTDVAQASFSYYKLQELHKKLLQYIDAYADNDAHTFYLSESTLTEYYFKKS